VRDKKQNLHEKKGLTPEQEVIYNLSERLVKAQRPIRVLNELKWGQEVEEAFFQSKCQVLPKIQAEDYWKRPLPYDPAKKSEEFYDIERDIRRQLGQFNGVGNIMQRMCREYRGVIRLIQTRGTPEFSKISQELYGSSGDAFYGAGPTVNDLAQLVSGAIVNIDAHLLDNNPADQKKHTAEEAVAILAERFSEYFTDHPGVHVKLSDDMVADASAGAESVRVRRGARFSDRDLRVLEVHEGWVHLGTTLNGMIQPICTFLSKGPPSSTVNQEGLAIIMELFTFSSSPERVRRLTDRITSIHMAENGANFLEVFRFFCDKGVDERKSYAYTARVFRGSAPEMGPFTKDLAYTKGFILIYNYIRLAIQRGLLARIPLLFLGKTTLEDLHVLEGLIEEGIVVAPKYIPPQFRDLTALSAWMCYSLFLNQLNLQRLTLDYKGFLHE
jgi:uncharacterized protein (TIGR02421 family)